MFDYLSNLPYELIEKVLDEISIFDILGCLCLVNKRLRSICLSYPRFRLDFSRIKKRSQFNLLCNELMLIESQIVSLSFSDRNDSRIPMKIENFFLHFELIHKKFSNLKSLHLSHVDLFIWNSIKTHVKSLPSLTLLFIDVASLYSATEISTITSYLLKDVLFLSITLKYFSLKCNSHCPSPSFSDICGKQISYIEHLTLCGIFIDLEEFYSILPVLRTLETTIHFYKDTYQFRTNPPENLQRLSLKMSNLYLSTIKQIVSPMKRLTDLVIIGYDMFDDVANGIAWEPILTNISSFEFSFTFHYRSIWNKETISLDSFQSLFWLEKKRWYVGYDRCTVSGFSLLYSIPYLTDMYPWFAVKGSIHTKTTGPELLTLNHVKYFDIDNPLLVDNKYLCRLTNLERLDISHSEISFHLLISNFVPHIDMSRITELLILTRRANISNDAFVQFVSNMSNLHSLTLLLHLLKVLFVSHWSNIRQLKIFPSCPTASDTETILTTNELAAFSHSFSHIEDLSFYQRADLNIPELLNYTPSTISNLVIHHPVKVIPADFPDFVTPDWLEKNSQIRHFSYYCNTINDVSVWF